MKKLICGLTILCLMMTVGVFAFASATEIDEMANTAEVAMAKSNISIDEPSDINAEEEFATLEVTKELLLEEIGEVQEGGVSMFALSYYSGTSVPTYTSITGRSLYTTGSSTDYNFYYYLRDSDNEEPATYIAYLEAYCGWTNIGQSIADDYSYVLYAFRKNGVTIGVVVDFDSGLVCVMIPKSTSSTVRVTGVSLDISSGDIKKGNSGSITATVSPSNATNKTVTWSSSNTSVATVSSSGVVTGVGPGVTTIKATTSDGGYTASCTIYVNRCGSSAYWNIDSYGTLTVSGSGAMYDYETYEDVPWDSSWSSVKKIVVNSGITSIGNYAFASCYYATSVSIPQGVTNIGDFAFTGCMSISSITLPTSIKTLGVGALVTYSGCTGIYISDTPYYSGGNYFCSVDGVLYNGDKSKLVRYPNEKSNTTFTVPSSVSIIDHLAFVACNNLESIIMPQSVTKIGARVFYQSTNLKSITLTNSVVYIGAETLGKCSSFSDVYFRGTQSEWNSITIDVDNDILTNATIHYLASGVSLNKSIMSLGIGKTTALTATVTPSYAENTSVTWKSSNTSVATVSSSGVVTGVAYGTATITATTVDGGYTASCTVDVNNPVTGISLNKTSLALNKGTSEILTATVTPSDASNKSVTWKSSNTSVATVSVNGVVTAVGGGTATITVTTVDGSYSKTCTVTVNAPVTGVSLDKTSLTLTEDATATLTAAILPGDATNKSVTWKSSDTSVATVNDGVVTAVGLGDATITVTTADGSFTATCAVSVKDYTPGDISGDGEVTTRDVTLLRRYIAGGYNVTVVEAALDVNHDGQVTTKDITLLRRYIAGGYGVELN